MKGFCDVKPGGRVASHMVAGTQPQGKPSMGQRSGEFAVMSAGTPASGKPSMGQRSASASGFAQVTAK